jgi:hypothetical protein
MELAENDFDPAIDCGARIWGNGTKAAAHPGTKAGFTMTNAELEKIQIEITKLAAETRKLVAEAGKLSAESGKLYAEAGKMTRETFWYPVAIASGMIAATVAVTTLVIKLLN